MPDPWLAHMDMTHTDLVEASIRSIEEVDPLLEAVLHCGFERSSLACRPCASGRADHAAAVAAPLPKAGDHYDLYS